MKDFFLLLFLAIILISVLYVGLEWNKLDEKTKIIAVHYYTKNCRECEELNRKMLRISWLFGRYPIVFIQYDQSNAETRFEAEKQLHKAGLLEIAQKDKGLRYVILYEAKSKKILAKINSKEDLKNIEQKIKKLLE